MDEDHDEEAIPEKDEEDLRIMITTDNHLGFEINDAIRGNDSFNTMEEIFQMAREHKCDMILFGGDLFHDNKPCQRTMYKTQQLFRKYCLGDNPVYLHLISNPQSNFTSAPMECVNYEDPNMSIDVSCLPFLLLFVFVRISLFEKK